MKIRVTHIFLSALFNFAVFVSFAQNNISYYKNFYKVSSDTAAINRMVDNFKNIRQTHIDSAIKIIHRAFEFSKHCNSNFSKNNCYYYMADAYAIKSDYINSNRMLDTAIIMAEKFSFPSIKADALNLYGINFSDQGEYEKSIEFYDKTREFSLQNGLKNMAAKANTNTGVSYYYLGDIGKAIDYYLRALKIFEEMKDSSNISILLSNVSVFYQQRDQVDIALEKLNSALKYCTLKDVKGRSDIYNNMAICFVKKNNPVQALDYYNRSIDKKKLIDDFKGIAQGYNNLAEIYMNLNNFQKAEEYSKKAVALVEGKNLPAFEAKFRMGLANIYFTTKDYKKSLESILKSTKIAQSANNKTLVCQNYYFIADVYRQMKDYQKSTDYMFLFQALNDSLSKAELAENIAEMEAKYQNEKKQKEIKILEQEKQIKTEEVKREQMQKYGFVGGFVLVLLLVLVVFRSYRQKRRDNLLLEAQEKEIEVKNDELNQQNEEIRTQRDEIESQKNKIEVIHEELTDSIRYAQRIQNAVLPEDLAGLEIFILFKPKDIVSGDFYFMAQRKQWLLIAVADCTGHGVPGAFMSMLGISFLNEIIAREEVSTAAQVLEVLRTHIIKSLQQKGVTGEQKDGMDIAFIAINSETLEMQFAGANNPIYIVDTGQCPVSTIREIRPDKQPIGIHYNMVPFTNHVTKLQKGDTLYLMSDGYEDQFGGPKGKKFLSKNLKKLLLDISQKPMNEQKEILDNTIENWREPRCSEATPLSWKKYVSEIHVVQYEQTDDITVMGIKI